MAQQGPNRLQILRARELAPDETRLVHDVEAYGCHIIQVRPEHEIPGWSYTIGLYETLQQPELIVVGLKGDTAHHLLNEAARRLKEGARLEGSRQAELLEGVECEFRRVEKRCLRLAMGYAIWFYGGDEFPVLQCIYPDLNNRFPWEDGFDADWRSRQALLFVSAPASVVEKDFCAANDPEGSRFDWRFPVPPHTGVFTTKRIANGEEPVLYASHDSEDGTWQFHGASESKVETAALVCFYHITDRDPTIKELADLPRGWRAWRDTASDSWVREPNALDPNDA